MDFSKLVDKVGVVLATIIAWDNRPEHNERLKDLTIEQLEEAYSMAPVDFDGATTGTSLKTAIINRMRSMDRSFDEWLATYRCTKFDKIKNVARYHMYNIANSTMK